MPRVNDTVGIDMGATLCKLARPADPLVTECFQSHDLVAILQQLKAWEPRRIVATGGGATRLSPEVVGAPVQRVPEFDAWAHGSRCLASRMGLDLPERYLLVSVGTGTSILSVDGEDPQRVGGTALGGGTLLGLGRLLLGTQSFAEMVALASRGDRRQVDLLVGDIYSEEAPLPPEMNAASFGKLASSRVEDLAHALVAMVGENIGLICGGLARSGGTEAVVYGGSTLSGNPPLEQTLAGVTLALGARAYFLCEGAFCGAAGAAVLADA